jgi:hypothetical protein
MRCQSQVGLPGKIYQPKQLYGHNLVCQTAGSKLLLVVLPCRAEGAAAARQRDDLQAHNAQLQAQLQNQKVGVLVIVAHVSEGSAGNVSLCGKPGMHAAALQQATCMKFVAGSARADTSWHCCAAGTVKQPAAAGPAA